MLKIKNNIGGSGGTVYICKRTGETEGGTIVLQFLPSQLVGQYFEIASEV